MDGGVVVGGVVVGDVGAVELGVVESDAVELDAEPAGVELDGVWLAVGSAEGVAEEGGGVRGVDDGAALGVAVAGVVGVVGSGTAAAVGPSAVVDGDGRSDEGTASCEATSAGAAGEREGTGLECAAADREAYCWSKPGATTPIDGIWSGPTVEVDVLVLAGEVSSPTVSPASPASGRVTAERMPPAKAAAASRPQLVPITGIIRPGRRRDSCRATEPLRSLLIAPDTEPAGMESPRESSWVARVSGPWAKSGCPGRYE